MQRVRQVQTQKKTQVAATFWDVAILTKLLLKLDPMDLDISPTL
jgi:hypothetical protein